MKQVLQEMMLDFQELQLETGTSRHSHQLRAPAGESDIYGPSSSDV